MKKIFLFLFLLIMDLTIAQTVVSSVNFDDSTFTDQINGSWSTSGSVTTSTFDYTGVGRSAAISDNSNLESPALDLTGATNVNLTFYFYNNGYRGGCNDILYIEYLDSTNSWQTLNTYCKSALASWYIYDADLNPSLYDFSATTKFRFRTTGKRTAYIDEVVITATIPNQSPTDPGDLTANNFTENSFDVSWGASSDPEGDAFTYNVYRDNSTNLVATGLSETSYAFTSLTANTTYAVFVEAEDSNGNTSAQTTKSFTTNKAPSSIESNFNGGTLTVGAGTAFTTTNITVGGGNVVVNSNSTNSGSFIVTGSVTSTSSDAFTYNRYIPDSNGRIISIPVSGQGVTAFVDNSANSLNTFGSFAALGMHIYQRAFGQRWEYYNPNAPGNFDSDFNVTKGYAVMRTQAGNISFTGDFPTLSSNQISFNIEAFVGSGLQKWRSIGNPFMSYFPGTNTSASVDTFLKLNGSKLDDNYQALYLWDGSRWAIVNNLSNYSVAPGQGFLVKLKDFTATTLDFPQSYQTHQTSEVFYDRETERSKISLYVEKNKRVAKTEIYYIPSGSQGLDPGYDAASYSTNKLDIQTRLIEESEDLNYAIQAISSFNYEEQVVPLSLTSQEDQKLTFSVEHESIPSELQIYLEDRENNKFYNLKESSAVLKVSQGTNKYGRFYIHTKPLEFWVEDNTEEDDNQDDSVFDLADGIASKAFDFFNLKDNILHFEGVNSKEQVRVNVFNLNGNKVFSTAEDLDTANNAIQLPYTLSEGVYIVELYRASGNKITKKIIVR